jgi:NitT/TauT family transport system substrate-binding protein
MSVTGVADLQSSFEEAPLEEFFVLKDSGIDSIEDLKGKKIAINLVKSSFHYTWLMALEAAGMSEDDVEFVVLSFDQQILALENGQVDAIGLMSPYSAEARNNDKLTSLYDATDIFGEKQFCDIIASTKFAEENPETMTAFVSGITDAMAWAMDNQEEAKEIIGKYTGIDPSMILDYKFQENGAVIMDDVQYWLDYMKAHDGNIKDSVTAESIATNEYNVKVQ